MKCFFKYLGIILLGLVLMGSCNNDDAIIEEGELVEESQDYQALKNFYDANPNTLSWDIEDVTMSDWEGVIQINGRVV